MWLKIHYIHYHYYLQALMSPPKPGSVFNSGLSSRFNASPQRHNEAEDAHQADSFHDPSDAYHPERLSKANPTQNSGVGTWNLVIERSLKNQLSRCKEKNAGRFDEMT